MADGRAVKQVKFHKPHKAHLHSLRDVCVEYEINSDICSGNEVWPEIRHIKAYYCQWSAI